MIARRLAVGACAAATAILSVALPAAADEPAECRLIRGAATPEDLTDDVEVCRQDVWLHKAEMPVGNAVATGSVAAPSWDTTEPEGEFQDAGVYLASSEADIFVDEGNPATRATFEGSFTGILDTLRFSLYLRSPYNENSTGTLGATVHLSVDGEVLHDNYDSAAIDLPMTAVGDYFRVDGAFLNIYEYMKLLAMDLDPETEHTVKIGIVGWFFPAYESAFLYDAAPVPSGLVFNADPTKLGGAVKIDVLNG